MRSPTASVDQVEAAIAPLRADPASAAVLLDLDGTLAPIVSRPEGTVITERARSALARIVESYSLLAIVSGRQATVAREIVGIEGITYAGIHGFELLRPGEDEARPSPALADRGDDARAFAEGLDRDALGAAGVRFEDKGPIIGLHWRGAADEGAAEALLEQAAAGASAGGLVVHRGRKVIELRPPVRVDKGTAVEDLIAEAGVRRALYAGDDRTDLDAFAALERLAGDGRLEVAVRIGVDSDEGPEEIVAEADLVVAGPAAMTPLLEALAG